MSYLFSGNSNYPPGLSDRTPGAPWNDERDRDNEEKEIDVEYSVILRKKTTVTTLDAIKSEWRDCDYADEGNIVSRGGVEWVFDNVDLAREYDDEHYTPIQLIEYLSRVLTDNIARMPEHPAVKEWKAIIEECEGWREEDEEVDFADVMP